MSQLQLATPLGYTQAQAIPQADPHHTVVAGGWALGVVGGNLDRFCGMERGLGLTTPPSKSTPSYRCGRRRVWSRREVPSAPPRFLR